MPSRPCLQVSGAKGQDIVGKTPILPVETARKQGRRFQTWKKIPEFRANLSPSADVYRVRHRLTFSLGGVKLEVELAARPVLEQVPCFRALAAFFPLNPHTVHGRVCHGCHYEVHYRLVCQRLRSQRLRSHAARTDYSRPRDPFGGRPGLSGPCPRLVPPCFMARPVFPVSPVFPARPGERPRAVASETAGRTTFVGAPEYVGNAPEYVGNIESGALSSQFPAGGRRAQAARLWAPAYSRPPIPRLR